MNEKEFKKRKLEKCYMMIYVVKKPIKIKQEEIIEEKMLCSLIGINLMGKRTIIGYYLDLIESRDWIRVFEDIKARGCEDILFIGIEEDKRFKRALNLVFSETIVVPSIHEKIEKLNRYFSDNYKNHLPKEIHDLFLSNNTDEFNINYQMLKENHLDNYLITTMIEKYLKDIINVCYIDIGLRRVLFNYYFLRDYTKRLRKLDNISFDTTHDDIIKLVMVDIMYLEKFKSSAKEEIRHNLNALNDLFGERMLRYL